MKEKSWICIEGICEGCSFENKVCFQWKPRRDFSRWLDPEFKLGKCSD